MSFFLAGLNVFFLSAFLFWALYKAHISDRHINRFSFVFVAMACTLVIIAHVVPSDSATYYQQYIWQRLLFSGALATRCFVEFYCEYGTPKWVEAFTNSKKRFLHITKRI